MTPTGQDVFQVMVAEKIKDIRKAISEIETEVNERKDIDAKVLTEIQHDLTEVRNRMLEVEQFSGAVEGNTPFPRIDVLEKEVVELEGQKRLEKVSCWRDLTSLRKEIRFYMRELNDILRKAELVKNDRSGRFAEKA
jgi:septal ring factor EnvC (AmiA/AmiB activator)